MQNSTIYRKDYKPYPFDVLSIYLSIDLYEEYALVSNEMVLKRTLPGELYLFGEDLELEQILLNDMPLAKNAYQLRGDDLVLQSCPDEFTLKLVTRIYPQENTALCGLYRSNQLFCTQCEAEGFRQITFFPDRPDVLTLYTTRISAVKADYPVLLSNGNLIEQGETADGRHWVVWQDPFKKPSYLFALVAGTLACVSEQFTTRSGRVIDLRIYVEPGNEDKCGHAMTSLKKAMRWDEEKYGREYDLDTFMIVAVSDFNMGAMENKGLNIFNSKYILACPKTATDNDYMDIEAVIGHEYFHNWTGNRVTCRDWFQLSLKEGLTVFREQEFSADMNSRDVNRILDVKILCNAQFPEDASGLAHSVRPESYQEINNFYTATIYNKGAEVIRMQHTLLTDAGFRRGMDLYFERHDGHAVTIDDFVAAMENANQIDLGQFKRWYSQAGTPKVSACSHYADSCLTLSFCQSCLPTPECLDKQPFHIPIRMALLDTEGHILQEMVLELKKAEEQYRFEGLKEKPVISLLRDFSAPITLTQTQSQDELLILLQFETNGYAKWRAAQTLVLDTMSIWFQSPKETWRLSEKLIQAFQHVLLDDSLDRALRADLLMPPDFEEVAATLTSVDVGLVELVRDAYRKILGQALFSQAETTYQTLWEQEDNRMHGDAYGVRKLRNTCLYLMMKANEAAALPYCQQQFVTARTMTDKMASFTLLANSATEHSRQQAIDAFYSEWSENDLVLDKWFAVQAMSEVPHALARVKALQSHPAFQMTNPNKVRALLGAFIQSNHRHFHALDGSGYVFLTEVLLQLDVINSQVAARLATPFTRWRRLDSSRQQLMRQQLQVLAAKALSRDLREVVDKSLG